MATNNQINFIDSLASHGGHADAYGSITEALVSALPDEDYPTPEEGGGLVEWARSLTLAQASRLIDALKDEIY